MKKTEILKDFLLSLETPYEQSHYGLLQLLEDIVVDSGWCDAEEFRDACYEYQILKDNNL